MLDSSMCFADLSVGDWFETNLYSDNGSKRYQKLAADFQTGKGANAVDVLTAEPVWFQPEDRVTLIR